MTMQRVMCLDTERFVNLVEKSTSLRSHSGSTRLTSIFKTEVSVRILIVSNTYIGNYCYLTTTYDISVRQNQ